MKKLSFILTILIGLGLSSCSFGRYVNPSQNLNLNQTQIVLSEANFTVVKHVSVSTIYTQSSLMRFSSDQLYQSAYAELLKKANLTGSQALINVTVELVGRDYFSFWALLFGWPPKQDCSIIASGVVIEFINPNVPQEGNNIISGDFLKVGGTIQSGGTLQGTSRKSVQSTSNNVTNGGTLNSTPSTQPTMEELRNAELQKEYLALQDTKDQSSGDQSLLGKYKRAQLVVINASTAGEKECEKYRKNFMSRFNELIYQQWYKDFTFKNNAQELTAELIIIDYNYDNDVASGFIRFKDASDSVLYSRCLIDASAKANATGFASLLQNEFE